MFYVIIVLLLLAGGGLTLLTVQNLSTQVHITLFTWQSPTIPLGLLVVGSFLLGAVLLYLVSVLSAWGDYRMMKRLRKRVTELEAQLAASPSSAEAAVPTLQARSGMLPTPEGQ